MSYEELVESRKKIGDMTKEELFEYCNGLLNEVWDYEKEIERLNNIINKGKIYCEDVIQEHENGEYNVSTTQLATEELKVRKIIELVNATYNMNCNIVFNKIESLKRHQFKIYYDYEIGNEEKSENIILTSCDVHDLNSLYNIFKNKLDKEIVNLYKRQS